MGRDQSCMCTIAAVIAVMTSVAIADIAFGALRIMCLTIAVGLVAVMDDITHESARVAGGSLHPASSMSELGRPNRRGLSMERSWTSMRWLTTP